MEQDPALWDHMEKFKVFARMTPQRKEAVLTALKDRGHFTLMCGDGSNDVGALKQVSGRGGRRGGGGSGACAVVWLCGWCCS